jgi:hypothetical protein
MASNSVCYGECNIYFCVFETKGEHMGHIILNRVKIEIEIKFGVLMVKVSINWKNKGQHHFRYSTKKKKGGGGGGGG